MLAKESDPGPHEFLVETVIDPTVFSNEMESIEAKSSSNGFVLSHDLVLLLKRIEKAHCKLLQHVMQWKLGI